MINDCCMKNRTYFLSFILLFSLSYTVSYAFGQSECYERIKKGEFRRVSLSDTSIVIREESYQEEIFNHGESRIGSSIKWISDTKYELKLIGKENVSDVTPPIGSVLLVEITACTEEYFECLIYYKNKEIGTSKYYFIQK